MTETSKSSTKESDAVPDPDEECQVCYETRANHGDKHHQFSLDGQLVTLPPPEKPRAEVPKTREEQQKEWQLTGEAFATLIEVLLEKEVLNTKDVMRILLGKG